METAKFDCKFNCKLTLLRLIINSVVNFDSLLEYFDVKVNHWYNILDLLVALFNFMDTKGMFSVKLFVSVKTSNGISGLVLATFCPF